MIMKKYDENVIAIEPTIAIHLFVRKDNSKMKNPKK